MVSFIDPVQLDTQKSSVNKQRPGCSAFNNYSMCFFKWKVKPFREMLKLRDFSTSDVFASKLQNCVFYVTDHKM